MTKKVNLVRSFMEVEGNLKLDMTWMEKDGSVKFTGRREYGENEDSRIEIIMDKYQKEAVENCKNVMEVYECYEQMRYF